MVRAVNGLGVNGLGRDDIVSLLADVATEAERREVVISLFLVGGAAMALAYSSSRATKDLDGIFEPKSVVNEIAAQVALQRPEYGLAAGRILRASTQYLVEAIAEGSPGPSAPAG